MVMTMGLDSLTTRSSKPPRNVALFKHFQTVTAAPHAPGDRKERPTAQCVRAKGRSTLAGGCWHGDGLPLSKYHSKAYAGLGGFRAIFFFGAFLLATTLVPANSEL